MNKRMRFHPLLHRKKSRFQKLESEISNKFEPRTNDPWKPRVSGGCAGHVADRRDSTPEISDSNGRRQKLERPFRDSGSTRRRGIRDVSGFETVRADVEHWAGSETPENVNRLFGIPKDRFTSSNIATKFEPSDGRREGRKARFELRGIVGAFRWRAGWTTEPNSADTPWVFRSKSESFVSKSESYSIEFESVISKGESYERNLTRVAGDPKRLPGELHAVASPRFKLAPTRIQRSHQ